MIGNDIVDLRLAKTQSNWQRPRFLEKIFTEEEREYINKSKNPEIEVWKLWTMKESAYKICNRETGIRGFFPWKLECLVSQFKEGKFHGSVSINDKIYFTEIFVNQDFVYTVAATSLDLIVTIVDVNPETEIIKIDGIPFVKNGLKPVSITHHGRYEKKITL